MAELSAEAAECIEQNREDLETLAFERDDLNCSEYARALLEFVEDN